MSQEYSCPNAYRKYGAPTLHCRALHDRFALCGHQYFCTISKEYELTKDAEKCKMKNSSV